MGTRCPNCDADNAWWGTDAFVVCPFCGAKYYPNASSPYFAAELAKKMEEEERAAIERNGGKPLTPTSAEAFRRGIERMLASKVGHFYIEDRGFPDEELAKIESMLPKGAKIVKVKENLSHSIKGVIWYRLRDRRDIQKNYLLITLINEE